ncbi:hypothetical protein FQA39_LY12080 [Lamprigera yunnana]|nr:hypothetical protein FQA39_LY12080 [Lamprigera yunnana]
MDNNVSKETIQAGSNLATGSDQVQASVTGAGSMDSGRSQQSLPQDNSDNGVDHLARTATSEDTEISASQKKLINFVETHIEFCNILQSEIDDVASTNKIIKMGNMNARVGNEIVDELVKRFVKEIFDKVEKMIRHCRIL